MELFLKDWTMVSLFKLYVCTLSFKLLYDIYFLWSHTSHVFKVHSYRNV